MKVLLSFQLQFVDANPDSPVAFCIPQTGNEIIYQDMPDKAGDPTGSTPLAMTADPLDCWRTTVGGAFATSFLNCFAGRFFGIFVAPSVVLVGGVTHFYVWKWKEMQEAADKRWATTNRALQELAKTPDPNLTPGKQELNKKERRALKKVIKTMSSTANLPDWATHPDVEKTDWLNEIVSLMWDQIVFGAEEGISKAINEQLKAHEGVHRGYLTLGTFRLGGTPPIIKGVRSYTREQQGSDQIIIDIGLMFANEIKLQLLLAGVPVFTFQNLHFSFTFRIILGPMIKSMSLFQSMEAGFSDKPEINFDVDIMQFSLMSIPFLETGLNMVINNVITGGIILDYIKTNQGIKDSDTNPIDAAKDGDGAVDAAVDAAALAGETSALAGFGGFKFPNMIVTDLLDANQMDAQWSAAANFTALGVLYVEIIEAHNLTNVDFFGKWLIP